ncbi:ABC transporter substrate-binding protein [Virgibacillus profundi]|uniref:ABC transporter substrate-binding protein n=2 Tax=Virgibacillus profundi TaxID=2024555 RepID=A0A2A2IK80_9BACI|nr:ABC transporter substrate-binding protein [Virgibacillus profundi]PXY55860.1 ABC transporter substrate-binding protein [Virgibacillus profundi]
MLIFFLFVILVGLLVGCSIPGMGGGDEGDDTSSNESSEEASAETGGEVYENGLPKDQKVTLKYGFFEGGLGSAWVEYAIETFEEKHPNVTIEMLASPDISQILSTRISAGDDEEMFDLFNRDPSGGIVSLAQAGKLEPLDELWEQKLPDTDAIVKDMMMNGIYESVDRIDGVSYQVPTSASVGGLFFNKNLFEEYGWNQNPQTWDKFTALLEQIKSDGITPITFPGMYPSYHDWAFGDVESFEIADIKGNADEHIENYQNFEGEIFTNPATVERWERIYELGKKGYFHKGLPALSHTQSQMQVLQGDVAMVSTGSHVENEMKNAAPEDFEWGYMSVPFVDSPDQKNWVRQSTTNGHYIWAAKPDLNKDWAKEFILWMLTLDVQLAAAEDGGAMPVRNDFIDDSKRYDKLQSSSKSVLSYIDENNVQLVKAYRAIAISHPSYDQAFKLRDESISNIFLGKEDPIPLLEEIETLIQEAISAQ